METQVVAEFGIGTREEREPIPGQGRTSDKAHERCDKAERSHLKTCLILQNQASRASLRTLTHLWGYSIPHSIKQGMKICQVAGESFWILLWKPHTGQSTLARLHGISRICKNILLLNEAHRILKTPFLTPKPPSRLSPPTPLAPKRGCKNQWLLGMTAQACDYTKHHWTAHLVTGVKLVLYELYLNNNF